MVCWAAEMIYCVRAVADSGDIVVGCLSINLIGERIDQVPSWRCARNGVVTQAIDTHYATQHVPVFVAEDGHIVWIPRRKQSARISAVTVRRNVPYRIEYQRGHPDR